jgi:23S rRNA (uridine2552-2'-O)-methyltransferase
MAYKRPDNWTRRAKEQGYAARSVFKLDAIEERHRVLPRAGAGAVDLGCYPGSWSRWLLERGLRVVGVDLRAPSLSGGTWLEASVFDVTGEQLLGALGAPPELVVSDMAPNTTGDRFVDHVRQIALADRALELAAALLPPGRGAFVVKVFDGGDAPAYTQRVRDVFTEVRRLKPDATRDRSVEFFLVGKGRR